LGAVGGGPDVLTASAGFGAANGLAVCGMAAGFEFARMLSIIRLLLFPSGSNSTLTSCGPILKLDPFLTAVFAASMAETNRFFAVFESL
jgi:hypothetical protein